MMMKNKNFRWLVIIIMAKAILVLNALLIFLSVLYFAMGKTTELMPIIIVGIIALDLGIIYGGLRFLGIEARIKDINNGQKL